MKILLAPNSFKGSMTAHEAACCMEKGLKESLVDVEIAKMPLADGGEGTVDALIHATNGSLIKERVHGPLGEIVEASYGILGNKDTAVIEMASASGLSLVPLDARNPMMTSTYGTGELILKAMERKIRHVILGVGGSATVDGGLGMAQALGIHCADEWNKEVPFGARGLAHVNSIDISGMHTALSQTKFEVACDVENPLTGSNGAAQVYGPQKGASPEMVIALERGLEHWRSVLERLTGKTLDNIQGTGAGGGIALPLLALTDAKIYRGIELVLEICHFEREITDCDLVITGEGRLDSQTIAGKGPIGIAKKAREHGIPVIAICGSIGPDAESVHREGIGAFLSALQSPVKEMELRDKGPEMLRICAKELGYILTIANGLKSK